MSLTCCPGRLWGSTASPERAICARGLENRSYRAPARKQGSTGIWATLSKNSSG
jgi:hypothetical protein